MTAFELTLGILVVALVGVFIVRLALSIMYDQTDYDWGDDDENT